MLSHCKCSLTPRKAQREILDLVNRDKKDEKKLYVVSPPGSGKTITGLMIAVEMNVPTLVLAPNTAIQEQWVQKTRFFIGADDAPIASSAHEDRLPITVLTYQSLARTRDIAEGDRARLLDAWQAELEEAGESAANARAWLRDYEERNPDRFWASLYRRWKGERLQGRAEGDVISEEALALMRSFRDRGVGLVIFDECHHLLGYWAQMALKLVEVLEHPRILGLTATPPSADKLTDREVELHHELLHDIDFMLPTPAVVKDGHLAPYQDLAYFTRPAREEMAFVRGCSSALSDVLAQVERFEGTTLSAWLAGELEGIGRTQVAGEWRRRPVFLGAAVRYLKERGLPVRADLAALADGPLELAERADLVGRYAVRCLLVSGSGTDRRQYDDLSRAFRPLGFQLTEKGLRRCQSTVGRLLALSEAKMSALVSVLTHELGVGTDVRALVITDFERSSATIAKEVSALLTEESGGAVAAMRALTSHEATDMLDPILVTGNTVLVDDDLLPVFEREAGAWLRRRGLAIELTAHPETGFYRVTGRGGGWNTRNYVAMITELFERGVTRCLVGTRGLLGEGWDSLRVNTLIDLTTAATDMTVNQLRGRAIRLDPTVPRKVANIWDIVCLAPEFERGLSDYKRFARKHAGYYGLCDDGAVEYGLGHIHPGLTETGPEDVALNAHVFNAEMLERSRDRDRIYDAWRVGEPYENSEWASLELKLEKQLGNRAVQGGLGSMKGYELSANEQLRNICMAVLEGLRKLGLLRDAKTALDVHERADRYFRIFLDSSDPADMDLFSRCVSELFQPIGEQRYMIPRYEQVLHDTWLSRLMPRVLETYFRRKENRIAVYHPLPACFADAKAHAERFSDAWNRHVSPGRAVFTKRGKGEELVVQAKANRQSVDDARAKIKRIWR